jgi:hypothetical protein
VQSPLSVAIVGLGPRGLSVLERLIVRLRRQPPVRDVVIWAVDPTEHGPGRVWRTDQPDCLAMNATAGELTVRSPDSSLPGSAFAPWAVTDPLDCPPRATYGRYLRDTFRRLCEATPPSVSVQPIQGEATALTRRDGRLVLTVADRDADRDADRGKGEPVVVDAVVLATGHPRQAPANGDGALAALADRHPRCTYIGGDIAPDMPLDDIPPGTTVAVRGLGLTFYDVVRSFSLGRGGHFETDGGGRLRYMASGNEPRIVAGSRGGLPFLARARHTDPPETAPRPVILTEERIDALRAEAEATRGTDKLDFAGEVEPLVVAEVQHAHDACAARLGVPRNGHAGLDLDALARPFGAESFASPAAFRRRLVDRLHVDTRESRRGPLGSPLKAGLEVLRQIRPLLPAVVDFGGLLPWSHRDFLERFEPVSYVLSAGPPVEHVEQLVALMEAGMVEIVGPAARFTADDAAADAAGCYAVESPRVGGSRRHAQVFVDARVPQSDISRDASPLVRQMLADGIISEYVNVDPATGERFATGGLAVTRAPFRVVDATGTPDPRVYAIGVAADRTRWFTQVGTGRPGKESPFCRDADAIAADILKRA